MLNLTQAAEEAFDFVISMLFRYFSGKCAKSNNFFAVFVCLTEWFLSSTASYFASSAGKSKNSVCPQENKTSTHLGFTIGKVFTGNRPVRLSVL